MAGALAEKMGVGGFFSTPEYPFPNVKKSERETLPTPF